MLWLDLKVFLGCLSALALGADCSVLANLAAQPSMDSLVDGFDAVRRSLVFKSLVGDLVIVLAPDEAVTNESLGRLLDSGKAILISKLEAVDVRRVSKLMETLPSTEMPLFFVAENQRFRKRPNGVSQPVKFGAIRLVTSEGKPIDGKRFESQVIQSMGAFAYGAGK